MTRGGPTRTLTGGVAREGGGVLMSVHRRGTMEVTVSPCDGLGGTFGGSELATNDDEVRVK
jgi:hypothetical protein